MSCDVQVTLTMIKDVILAVAAIVTSSVAIVGLSKWRAELRGKTEYEVARRVIRGLYKVRDAFNAVRSPMIWASEYPEGYSGAAASTANIDEKTADLHVYQNRWKYLAEALGDLEAEALEAEVIWGEEIENSMREIRGCRSELQVALREYLAKVGRVGHDREEYRRIMEKISNFDGTDSLSKRIAAAIGALESKVRPHLRH